METSATEYSINELMDIFQLSKPLTRDMINSRIDMYKRSRKNRNITSQNFIMEAGVKLCDSIEMAQRHESTTYSYDSHSVLTQLKSPTVNYTKKLETTADKLNPTFINTTTRTILLNSKFREEAIPLVNPDISYCDVSGCRLNKSSSTQYTAHLSDTLTDTVSLKLFNITIPYLWYNIDTSYGNNFFEYYSSNTPDHQCLDLKGGHYYLSGNGDANIYHVLNVSSIETGLQFEYDALTGKTKIQKTNPSDTLTIVWYNILNIINQKTKSNNNLGWKLGFRKNILVIPANVQLLYSDAPADLTLTNYLLLSIDDYNNHQLNDGLISIQDRDDRITMDSTMNRLKVSKCPDLSENFYQYSTGSQGEITGITKAQVATINAVAKHKNKVIHKTISPTDCIFAVIPMNNTVSFGQTITFNNITLLNNKREYFGPVKIRSLKIKLLTEDGYVLNLNNIDWSFALLCKQLYQY